MTNIILIIIIISIITYIVIAKYYYTTIRYNYMVKKREIFNKIKNFMYINNYIYIYIKLNIILSYLDSPLILNIACKNNIVYMIYTWLIYILKLIREILKNLIEKQDKDKDKDS